MKEVKIGSQIWAKEDLKVLRFRNGDLIPVVRDPKEWTNMESAAMCINPDTGGYLYNWYAVNDERGLAPEGWHIPSDAEWTKLTNDLGGLDVAGFKMKSSPTDTSTWYGSNSSGFSALPGGYRDYDGDFLASDHGYWWSSSPHASGDAWFLYTAAADHYVNLGYNNIWRYGFSVRCIKDEVVCTEHPKKDLRAEFDKHSVLIDALTEEMNKKFDELTSRLDGMAEEMEIMQSTIESFWVSKKP